jgi:hypothetical protein
MSTKILNQTDKQREIEGEGKETCIEVLNKWIKEDAGAREEGVARCDSGSKWKQVANGCLALPCHESIWIHMVRLRCQVPGVESLN